MAGNCSIETCGNIFKPEARKASSNYGVGTDGRIGMYVEEKNRAWTSSNATNDQMAVTIEVANDGKAPDWHVSDKALAATIELCYDICKRNKIEKLVYTGDTNGNLTRHDFFANTTCPGPYLGGKFPYIVAEVNKKLDADRKPAPVVTPVSTTIKVGDVVKITGSHYYGGTKTVPSWVKAKNWIVREVKGDRAVIDKSEDGKNSICSPINTKDITVAKAAAAATKPAETPKPVEKPVDNVIKVGSIVKIQPGATYYNSFLKVPNWVVNQNWIVRSISGKRVVIDKNERGTNSICSPIDIKFLTKVK